LGDWFEAAAEQGHASGQNNLGVMYFNGEGVYKNMQVAHSLFFLAAKQGLAKGEYNLGMMYKLGYGVVKQMFASYSPPSAREASGAGREAAAEQTPFRWFSVFVLLQLNSALTLLVC
jgi:TPR repeat protein